MKEEKNEEMLIKRFCLFCVSIKYFAYFHLRLDFNVAQFVLIPMLSPESHLSSSLHSHTHIHNPSYYFPERGVG